MVLTFLWGAESESWTHSSRGGDAVGLSACEREPSPIALQKEDGKNRELEKS